MPLACNKSPKSWLHARTYMVYLFLMEEEEKDSWASRVRTARKQLELSQIELAAKAGVHVNSIIRIEKGIAVSDDLKFRVASALGVGVLDLFPFELFPKEVAR